MMIISIYIIVNGDQNLAIVATPPHLKATASREGEKEHFFIRKKEMYCFTKIKHSENYEVIMLLGNISMREWSNYFKYSGSFVLNSFLIEFFSEILCKCQNRIIPVAYSSPRIISTSSMLPCLYLLNIAETYNCSFKQIWCLLANRKILFRRALFYKMPGCMKTFVCCHISICYCF